MSSEVFVDVTSVGRWTLLGFKGEARYGFETLRKAKGVKLDTCPSVSRVRFSELAQLWERRQNNTNKCRVGGWFPKQARRQSPPPGTGCSCDSRAAQTHCLGHEVGARHL